MAYQLRKHHLRDLEVLKLQEERWVLVLTAVVVMDLSTKVVGHLALVLREEVINNIVNTIINNMSLLLSTTKEADTMGEEVAVTPTGTGVTGQVMHSKT